MYCGAGGANTSRREVQNIKASLLSEPEPNLRKTNHVERAVRRKQYLCLAPILSALLGLITPSRRSSFRFFTVFHCRIFFFHEHGRCSSASGTAGNKEPLLFGATGLLSAVVLQIMPADFARARDEPASWLPKPLQQ